MSKKGTSNMLLYPVWYIDYDTNRTNLTKAQHTKTYILTLMEIFFHLLISFFYLPGYHCSRIIKECLKLTSSQITSN